MLKEAVDTAYLHFNRANDHYEDILKYPLDLKLYENKEQIKSIDAFIFRFIKLQDFMGDKLFKELLKRVGEYKDNMSLLDVLDRLEKLEIIDNSDRWIEYRIIRNKLTHEYPNNEADILEGIKLALVYFAEMGNILKNISSYLKERNLHV